MAANLAKVGLYVDDFNKLRILDPSIAQSTLEFKEECAGFINSNLSQHCYVGNILLHLLYLIALYKHVFPLNLPRKLGKLNFNTD